MLLEHGNKTFHFLFSLLPPDCTEKMFSYLSDEYWRILIGAFYDILTKYIYVVSGCFEGNQPLTKTQSLFVSVTFWFCNFFIQSLFDSVTFCSSRFYKKWWIANPPTFWALL